MDRLEEVLEFLMDAVVDLMLKEDVGGFCLLVEGLEEPRLVNLNFGELFLLTDQVL